MNLRRLGLVITTTALLTTACFEDPLPPSTDGDDETGDGDGDPSGDGDGAPAGDGDGDPSGDGDGDPSGDGDGDPSGDGDGAPTGDGDGAPAELVLFDLYELACSAEWIAAADPQSAAFIDCNGRNTGEGAALQQPSFEIETNELVDDALLVIPYFTPEGLISGSFAGLDLSGATNPVLRTTIACPADELSCDVQWQINVRPAGQDLAPIVENGFQSFDGGVDTLEIDLSSLLEPVDVALIVLTNGDNSTDDIGVFVHPRIVELE